MIDIENAVLIFHEPDCCGLIVSNDAGELRCSECREIVGQVQPAVLQAIIGELKLPAIVADAKKATRQDSPADHAKRIGRSGF